MPITFNYHAEALVGLGRYQEALYSAQQALVLGAEDKTPEYIGMAWRALGIVSDKVGEPISVKDPEIRQTATYDADTCFSKSEKIFSEAEIELERARTLREWAKYHFKAGDQQRAATMWQDARDIFANLGADMEVQRMSYPPV